MKYIVTNLPKLINIFSEIKQEVNKGKVINLSWDVAHAPKTKAQLGFAFGVIFDSIQKAYIEFTGTEYDTEVIKELMYQTCSIDQVIEYWDIHTNDLKTIVAKKRISNMTKEEMVQFITNMLDWCAEYEIKLPAEAMYLWMQGLDPLYIEEVSETKYPDKDPMYLKHVRNNHCILCGKFGCEAHHLKADAGLGSTMPDYHAVPLCDECHRNYEGSDGHISTDKIKSLTPFIRWELGEKTVVKLMYDRWRQHR